MQNPHRTFQEPFTPTTVIATLMLAGESSRFKSLTLE